ncbi:hypothetical protein [Ornithobacterium rhinotracheale]
MKKLILLLILIVSCTINAQSLETCTNYYNNREYKKAFECFSHMPSKEMPKRNLI